MNFGGALIVARQPHALLIVALFKCLARIRLSGGVEFAMIVSTSGAHMKSLSERSKRSANRLAKYLRYFLALDAKALS